MENGSGDPFCRLARREGGSHGAKEVAQKQLQQRLRPRLAKARAKAKSAWSRAHGMDPWSRAHGMDRARAHGRTRSCRATCSRRAGLQDRRSQSTTMSPAFSAAGTRSGMTCAMRSRIGIKMHINSTSRHNNGNSSSTSQNSNGNSCSHNGNGNICSSSNILARPLHPLQLQQWHMAPWICIAALFHASTTQQYES